MSSAQKEYNGNIARVYVLIRGRVQGVFFRSSTRSLAESLDLHGYARNLPGGDVEAVFEGQGEAVRKALSWCRRGPARARVDSIETRWEEPAGEAGGFRIL